MRGADALQESLFTVTKLDDRRPGGSSTAIDPAAGLKR
jgi:hypothetical protein